MLRIIWQTWELFNKMKDVSVDKTFLAYQVEEKRYFLGKILERSISDLPKGNLTVKVLFFPELQRCSFCFEQRGYQKLSLYTGIDAVGEVVDCLDNSFEYGEKVIITGYDLGMIRQMALGSIYEFQLMGSTTSSWSVDV